MTFRKYEEIEIYISLSLTHIISHACQTSVADKLIP
jgi:hypothetical protein